MGLRENYATLKEALHEKFLPKERVELHKAEFRARHRKRDEKLPDLASSLRRLVGRAYPDAVPDLQDSLAKAQFMDALKDREIRIKLRESGPKTLDEAVSRALQIKAMYEAQSRGSNGRSVRVVQERSKRKSKSKVVHLYSAFITKSQRRFTMINLPPADWKHIQAKIAAASKQSMQSGTHFTDLGRMES